MCFKLLIYWFVLVFIVRTWRTASELFVFLRDSQQQAVSDQEPVEKKHNSSSEFTALPVGVEKTKRRPVAEAEGTSDDRGLRHVILI